MPPTGSQSSVADDERATDHEVIVLLLSGPPIWTIEDLAREIGATADVHSSITRLEAAGLIHSVDGAVFATRAAHVAATLDLAEAA